jgi:hypothetical protein
VPFLMFFDVTTNAAVDPPAVTSATAMATAIVRSAPPFISLRETRRKVRRLLKRGKMKKAVRLKRRSRRERLQGG